MEEKKAAVAASPDTAKQLTPVTIDQLVSNQGKELELRAKELEFQKQQDDHSFEYGKRALEAHLQDRKEQREYNKGSRRNFYVLIAVLTFIGAVVVTVALFLNKDAFATEVIKAAAYLAAGYIGGYGIGKKNTKQPPSINPPSVSQS